MLGKGLSDMTLNAQSMKEKMISCSSSKLKCFCCVKDNISNFEKKKLKAILERKYFQVMYLTKDLYSGYIKNSQNSMVGNQTTYFKNGQKLELMLHQRGYKHMCDGQEHSRPLPPAKDVPENAEFHGTGGLQVAKQLPLKHRGYPRWSR